MEKDEVVIVVPIYQKVIAGFEHIALQQCKDVLGQYPTVFIAPESLPTKHLEETYGINTVIRFADSYFSGIDGYNRLMLSPEFYERFLDYKYMLIYQLDAYVFDDRLLEWCKRGYDYIGAPWIPRVKYNHPLRRAELRITQAINRLFSSYHSRSNYYHTGNGGFSLRRTEVFHAITLSDRKQINDFLSCSSYHYAEDIYWGIHVNHQKQRLHIPHYSEALSFSFENNPEELYARNGNALPFGAHAWYKGDRLNFWKQFIPQTDTIIEES